MKDSHIEVAVRLPEVPADAKEGGLVSRWDSIL